MSESKAQETAQAEMQNREKEITGIVYALFEKNKDGQQLLKYMNEMIVESPKLPVNPDALGSYGTIEAYLAYHEGSRSIVQWIKSRIKYHDNMNRPQIVTR